MSARAMGKSCVTSEQAFTEAEAQKGVKPAVQAGRTWIVPNRQCQRLDINEMPQALDLGVSRAIAAIDDGGLRGAVVVSDHSSARLGRRWGRARSHGEAEEPLMGEAEADPGGCSRPEPPTRSLPCPATSSTACSTEVDSSSPFPTLDEAAAVLDYLADLDQEADAPAGERAVDLLATAIRHDLDVRRLSTNVIHHSPLPFSQAVNRRSTPARPGSKPGHRRRCRRRDAPCQRRHRR